jgi:hypothetical protein
MPQSSAPTAMPDTRRCRVSMLEPHWRFVLKAETSIGRPASRATEPRPMNSPDWATLPRPTSSIIEGFTFGLRSMSERMIVAPTSSRRVATSLPRPPRAKGERTPSTITTFLSCIQIPSFLGIQTLETMSRSVRARGPGRETSLRLCLPPWG